MIDIFDELIPHFPMGQSIDSVHELCEIRRQPPGIDVPFGKKELDGFFEETRKALNIIEDYCLVSTFPARNSC